MQILAAGMLTQIRSGAVFRVVGPIPGLAIFLRPVT
jgi:hypothetical protein